jgi:phospholipid/cholesterol/gamma-HCH transport system permease protein
MGPDAGRFRLSAGGDWTVAHIATVDTVLRNLSTPKATPVVIDIAQIDRLDTAGAWVLHRTFAELEAAGVDVGFANVSDNQAVLLRQVGGAPPAAPELREPHTLADLLEALGRQTVQTAKDLVRAVNFFGLALATLCRVVIHPSRFRGTSVVYHMQQVGLNALPIVALLTFLIGIVLAYLGAEQLRQFGADILIAELVGLATLREIGVLLMAVVVAGRSGSAFTAQIGAMKVREEIDAMQTIGLDPMEVLVLPRLMAMVITLPLLAFLADLAGLAGGCILAWVVLDISPLTFIERIQDFVDPWSFWVGIIKAPVMAMLIALVGCYQGLMVAGSAESVGQHTTTSVVQSIFLVIVADSFFAIFFHLVGV